MQKPPKDGRVSVCPWNRAKLKALYREATVADIARLATVAPTTASAWLRKIGIEPTKGPRELLKPTDVTKVAKVGGARLRATRLAKRLSQAEMADRLGLPEKDTVRRWENGEQNISGDYLLRWMLICNIDAASLVGEPNKARATFKRSARKVVK